MPRLTDLPTLSQPGTAGAVLATQSGGLGGSGLLPVPALQGAVLAGRARYGAAFGMDPTAADNSAAVQAANAAPGPIPLAPGAYATNLPWVGITAPFRGPGQVRDAAGNLRAPCIVAVAAEPSSAGWDGDSILTAFNGDFSAPLAAVEHRISGPATLGTPSTGYHYHPHTAAYVGHLLNTSGHNESQGGNDGRTAAAHIRLKVENAGQGDAMAIYASAVVSGQRPGATHFLANPAAAILGADIFAGGDGVFLNPFEVTLDDLGHDAAGIGWVVNLKRANAGGALSAYWAGLRVQSTGAAPADAAFTAAGAYRIGLDLATGQYGAGQAAVTLGADHRIYFGCANGSPILGPDETSLSGNNYLTWSTALQGFAAVVYDVPAMQWTAQQVTSTRPFAVYDGDNGVKLSPAGVGFPPVIQAFGADADVPLALLGKGAGGLLLGAPTDRVGFFGYAPVPKQTLAANPTPAQIAALLESYGLAALQP